MSKRKNHYYVMVFTGGGPVYVVGVNSKNNVARWDPMNPPVEMTREDAKSVCVGLNINGFASQVICSPYPVERQPYDYENFTVEIKRKESEK